MVTRSVYKGSVCVYKFSLEMASNQKNKPGSKFVLFVDFVTLAIWFYIENIVKFNNIEIIKY